MSDVRPKSLSFLDLYGAGKVTAEQIDDFIDAWRESDDSEQRPLSQFAGLTEDEYSAWLASHKVLPLLIAARRDGRSVTAVVRKYLADLRHAALPAHETAIHILSHWLGKHMDGQASFRPVERKAEPLTRGVRRAHFPLIRRSNTVLRTKISRLTRASYR